MEVRPPGERRFGGGLKELLAQGDALRARLAGLTGGRRALQDDPTHVTLQVGRRVFEGAPRRMRIELWMSSLQRKGLGVAAADEYPQLLLAVRLGLWRRVRPPQLTAAVIPSFT